MAWHIFCEMDGKLPAYVILMQDAHVVYSQTYLLLDQAHRIVEVLYTQPRTSWQKVHNKAFHALKRAAYYFNSRAAKPHRRGVTGQSRLGWDRHSKCPAGLPQPVCRAPHYRDKLRVTNSEFRVLSPTVRTATIPPCTYHMGASRPIVYKIYPMYVVRQSNSTPVTR